MIRWRKGIDLEVRGIPTIRLGRLTTSRLIQKIDESVCERLWVESMRSLTLFNPFVDPRDDVVHQAAFGCPKASTSSCRANDPTGGRGSQFFIHIFTTSV